MPLLSIVIPCHGMSGRGLEMLSYNFKQLQKQRFKNFNVIISDDSQDEVIKTYVLGIKDLDIIYTKNEGKHGIGGNLNNGIKNATGEIIQIMSQDDYFYNKDSLQHVVNAFDKNKGWLVSSYMHTKDRLGLFKRQTPSWHEEIYFNNTIGTLSCLSFVNNDVLFFDENLSWFVDGEYYYRLWKKYGLPNSILDIVFIQYLWEGQTTNTITQELVDTEMAYINSKLAGEIA